MQLRRNRVVTTEVSALLEGLMRGRAGLRCALEECGGRCVTTAGAPLMLVLCAGSWGSRWMCQGLVSVM